MIDISEEEVIDFLEHFGVLGMRWGIRKQERREARAQKHIQKAQEFRNEINRIKAQPLNNPFKRARANRKIKNLIDEERRQLNDAERKRQGKLTKSQKKLAIGAGAAAAIVATVGTYKLANSGKFRELATEGKSFITRNPNLWHKNSNLSDPAMSVEKIAQSVVPQINSNYGEIGTKVNCRRCTFAYEMRRRGHDVAATKTTNAAGQHPFGFQTALEPGDKEYPVGTLGLLTRFFKEKKTDPNSIEKVTALAESPVGRSNILPSFTGGHVDSDRIFRAVAQNPERARGELGVKWLSGGGHSIAWEIIDGKPVFFDTQIGKTISTPQEFSKTYGTGLLEQAGFTRLDNLPLNTNFLTRWLKNA